MNQTVDMLLEAAVRRAVRDKHQSIDRLLDADGVEQRVVQWNSRQVCGTASERARGMMRELQRAYGALAFNMVIASPELTACFEVACHEFHMAAAGNGLLPAFNGQRYRLSGALEMAEGCRWLLIEDLQGGMQDRLAVVNWIDAMLVGLGCDPRFVRRLFGELFGFMREMPSEQLYGIMAPCRVLPMPINKQQPHDGGPWDWREAHDDPPCRGVMLDANGDCPVCNVHPDMQSKMLVACCPQHGERLAEDHTCAVCGSRFEHP